MARRPAVHPGSAVEVPRVSVAERFLGGLVVDGCLGLRRPGSPNGPQSPRLAPGGFYGVGVGRD